MPLYLDACALAKRYLQEGRSTQTMKTITGRPHRWGGLIVSDFIEVEVVSALAKAVRKLPDHVREQGFRNFPKIVDGFRREYENGTLNVVESVPTLLGRARELLVKRPIDDIGAGDAIHLAAALAAREQPAETPFVFVTADWGLHRAASAHRLAVFNPIYGGVSDLERMMGLRTD